MLEKSLQVISELEGISVEEVIKTRNPIQRLLEPEEIASMTVYLASDSAKGITGQSYNVSGGYIMH